MKLCVRPVANNAGLNNTNQNVCIMIKYPFLAFFVSLGNEFCIIISSHQGIRRQANLHIVLPLFKQSSGPTGALEVDAKLNQIRQSSNSN